MCQHSAVASGISTRVSTPASSNRHSSTRSADSEKIEKLVPTPSNVAPSGYGWPGQICMHTPTHHTQAPSACFPPQPHPFRGKLTIPVPRRLIFFALSAVCTIGFSSAAAFRLDAEATSPRLEWLPALAGRLRAASDFSLTAGAASAERTIQGQGETAPGVPSADGLVVCVSAPACDAGAAVLAR